MRIERLAEDNKRTQGAERRAWYRRHAPQHLAAVARLVDDALAGRAPEAPAAVAVLGAGACTELPLEPLARAAERVALVDLDVPGMERARQELPASLRSRVRVVAADITGGVSDALGAALRAQPWQDLAQLSAQAAIGAAAGVLGRVTVPDPPPLAGLGEGVWGVVISSFVLTQLFSLPLLDVRDQLALVVAPDVAPDDDARFAAAARGFRRRVALAHVHLLAALAAPGGSVLFMSDTTGHLLPPTSGAHAREPHESLDLLPAGVLALPRDFAPELRPVGTPRHWEWLVSAPAPNQYGRAYDAVGAVLRRSAEHEQAGRTPG